jgi:hypothetical protein
LAETIRLHQHGESLGKSNSFLAALPPGESRASAIFYQDPSAMMALQLQQVAPDMAKRLSPLLGVAPPAIVAAYADEDAIREVSTSPALDAGFVLAGAAIAIPNLLRSRIAANEASAVGKVRELILAEGTYNITYPDRGFSPDLATLGPAASSNGAGAESADHAGLIDPTLGAAACTGTNWCVASGYRFIIKASCGFGKCNDFVAIATPVASNTGGKSFCSTSDGIIRMKSVSPLTAVISVPECKRWPPLR